MASVSFITYPLTTFLKPIPIICLIIGVLQKNLLPQAKMLMVSALIFSLLGDVVLTLPVSLSMKLGIGCFLLVHCCYIALFLKVFKYRSSHLAYYLLVTVFISFFVSLLLPRLDSLLIPVIIYLSVLMLMLFCAFQVKFQELAIGIGALFFALSDLALALSMFVYPQIDTRVFVMLSYYAAQLLLISGLIAIYKQGDHSLTDDEEMNLRFV
ncbi:putative inner membrane protein [Legionella fallonii LLAP-10]|uniref:Putative inner membrane protein n=2 Tax=Legionella fallonii TaxID=96230 RepID=A0A098G6G2_9GAMM|nr:putative inner membrane protein [Legionella fallonii LLAP-10]